MSFGTLNAIALAFYILASVCYGAFVFLATPAAPITGKSKKADVSSDTDSENAHSLRWTGRVLLLLGVLFQFAATGVWCVTMHRSPFASEYGTLSVLAWIIAVTFALIDLRRNLPAVGAIALPVACVILFWAMLHVHGPVADTTTLKSQIVSLHVLAILASYGLFALAFGCAALYLLQNRLLKQRAVNSLFHSMPPLASLDAIAYCSVAYALPLLTLGLGLGVADIFSKDSGATPSRWLLDAHTLASFGTWGLYVTYLGTRIGLGWRGIRPQYLLLVGLIVAIALYAIPSATHSFNTFSAVPAPPSHT